MAGAPFPHHRRARPLRTRKERIRLPDGSSRAGGVPSQSRIAMLAARRTFAVPQGGNIMRSISLAAATVATLLFLAAPARANEGFLGSGNEAPTFGGGVGHTSVRITTGRRIAAVSANDNGTFGGGVGRSDDSGQLGSGNIEGGAPGIGAGVGINAVDGGQLGSGNIVGFGFAAAVLSLFR
jgi:hypothetical protein